MQNTQFVSPAELAAIKPLGRRVAPQTIRTWITRGLDGRRLPAQRLGGRWMVSVADAERFLGVVLSTNPDKVSQ